MSKVKTGMKFGDKEYAFVPDRLKQFREENPKADIDTNSTLHPDGSITIKTVITKDRSDEASARGSGTARYTEVELKKAKAFEKLETISIGRALSTIGYLNNGEIASGEEMEEFLAHKEEQHRNAVILAIESIEDSKTIEELKEIYVSLGSVLSDPDVIAAKDKRKAELTKKEPTK